MQHQFRRARDERGAQAVEFALIFTFALGPLIYAIIAFGIILNTQVTASQLARETVRTASICWASNSSPAMCEAAGSARYNQAATGVFVVSAANPTPLEWSSCDPSGSCVSGTTSKCLSAGTPQPSLTATVKVRAPIGLGIFGIPNVLVTGRASTACGG